MAVSKDCCMSAQQGEASTDWTLWQHWMGPVVQDEVGSGLVAVWVTVIVLVVVDGGCPPGMAAARTVRAKRK